MKKNQGYNLPTIIYVLTELTTLRGVINKWTVLSFCEGERSPAEVPCCDMIYSIWNPSQTAEEASHATFAQMGSVSNQSFMIICTHHPTPE